MDRVTEYHQILRTVVEEYAADWKPRDGTHLEAVTDSQHGHYQIMRSGWKDGRFVHSCLVHLAIRGGEVQLLKNDTEIEWDRELAQRGIAPKDIVLAFRQPLPQHAASAG
ncbi:MAG: XisI protein [Planctomycetes bacterium]|nr:XisI protein [Planctomycetota bacterium]